MSPFLNDVYSAFQWLFDLIKLLISKIIGNEYLRLYFVVFFALGVFTLILSFLFDFFDIFDSFIIFKSDKYKKEQKEIENKIIKDLDNKEKYKEINELWKQNLIEREEIKKQYAKEINEIYHSKKTESKSSYDIGLASESAKNDPIVYKKKKNVDNN